MAVTPAEWMKLKSSIGCQSPRTCVTMVVTVPRYISAHAAFIHFALGDQIIEDHRVLEVIGPVGEIDRVTLNGSNESKDHELVSSLRELEASGFVAIAIEVDVQYSATEGYLLQYRQQCQGSDRYENPSAHGALLLYCN